MRGESRTAQSKPEQKQWTENMRQKGDGQEVGGKSRRGHEQGREGRGQSFYHALQIGHSEAMRNMWQAYGPKL